MDSKLCNSCSISKPLAFFYKHSTTKDGLRTSCKACIDSQNKLWRDNNPDRMKLIWTKHNSNPRRRINYHRDKEQNKLKYLLNSACQRAKNLNLPFDITLADLPKPQHCPVLGMELNYASTGLVDESPSIDRIIPSLGYVRNNIRIMSNLANRMKSSASEAQLKEFAIWVQNNVRSNAIVIKLFGA